MTTLAWLSRPCRGQPQRARPAAPLPLHGATRTGHHAADGPALPPTGTVQGGSCPCQTALAPFSASENSASSPRLMMKANCPQSELSICAPVGPKVTSHRLLPLGSLILATHSTWHRCRSFLAAFPDLPSCPEAWLSCPLHSGSVVVLLHLPLSICVLVRLWGPWRAGLGLIHLYNSGLFCRAGA